MPLLFTASEAETLIGVTVLALVVPRPGSTLLLLVSSACLCSSASNQRLGCIVPHHCAQLLGKGGTDAAETAGESLGQHTKLGG